MTQPLPQDKYLYAKLDPQFRYLYVNDLYKDLFGQQSESILGKTLQEIRKPSFPLSVMEDTLSRVQKKGYAYTVVPHDGTDNKQYWGFIDLTRRFGAAANSGMIGYEFVSYPASQAVIDFFDPIYREVLRLEKTNNSAAALKHINDCVAKTGKAYDELVHTLQNT